MALILSTETNYGFSCPTAYVKVDLIGGSKESMAVNVSYYYDQQASAGKQPLKQESYTFVPDIEGDNFIRQAYLYLKTLPEFQTAIDA